MKQINLAGRLGYFLLFLHFFTSSTKILFSICFKADTFY